MNSSGSSRSVTVMCALWLPAFSCVSQEKEIEENDLRYLAEECDSLQVRAEFKLYTRWLTKFQGFQTSFDIAHYGGFMSSFHELLQDEYPKADTLNFAFLATKAHSKTYNVGPPGSTLS
jgi:hypothetical protein